MDLEEALNSTHTQEAKKGEREALGWRREHFIKLAKQFLNSKLLPTYGVFGTKKFLLSSSGIVSWPTKLCFLHAHHFYYCCAHQKPSRIGWLVIYTSFKSSQILLSDWLKTGGSGAMTWSKAIYPPLHDLLFIHQLSGGQIKSLVGELQLKKVVGQDPQRLPPGCQPSLSKRDFYRWFSLFCLHQHSQMRRPQIHKDWVKTSLDE